MSEIKTFFRFCPECGRRFHIKLVSKNLINVEREKEEISQPAVISPRYSFTSAPAIIVQEGEPVTVDIEEFQYAYKCGHCGHEWNEKHMEEVREK